MPYIKFSKETKFEGSVYFGRSWYQVSKALGERMARTYPASSTLVNSIPDEYTPVGDSVAAEIDAAVEAVLGEDGWDDTELELVEEFEAVGVEWLEEGKDESSEEEQSEVPEAPVAEEEGEEPELED